MGNTKKIICKVKLRQRYTFSALCVDIFKRLVSQDLANEKKEKKKRKNKEEEERTAKNKKR